MKGGFVDLDIASQWVSLAALLLGIGNLLWAWISRPARDVGKRVDDLDTRIDDHGQRIQRIEADISHLPTKNDVHQLDQKLIAVTTELNMIARVVTRIDDNMRNRQ